ncbi:MAG: response regulator [Bdellovibrionales bacterium]|nr:response regulator [Bdellovibrionales bacterium]
MDRIRVLIADDDSIQSRRLADYISARGFEARVVTNGKDARAQIVEWKPRYVLADLVLLEGNALELIDFIKNEKSLRHSFISVLVMSGHNDAANVRQALQRGAKDYIVKPIKPEDILKRLIFHSRSYRQLNDLQAKDYSRVDEASLMLHLTDLVLRQALGQQSLEEILFNLTRMVSIKVDGVRCSIIHVLDQKDGRVVISNDDRKASGIQLDLYRYPEVVHVMNTQSLIAIENLEESAELRHVRQYAKDIAFNSMIVCPVTRYGHPFGVLSLRLPPEKQTISDNEIRFVEIVSHVVSLVLSNELHKNTGDFWIKHDAKQFLVFPMRNIKNS